MRVLSAHPPNARDAQATARGLRLVWDILQRRGLPCEVYQVPGIMPLVTVGNGPLLLCTYLDDLSPAHADKHAPAVPGVSGDVASGAGVTRRAGLLATIGPVASADLHVDDVTLIIEADRHLGSVALQSWLEASDRAYQGALWEASDLPVSAPATFQSSTGNVTLEITVRSETEDVEAFYAGVLPDIGHQLAGTLAALKSRDSEVLVPGFYDGIETPGVEAIASLNAIAEDVQAWASRGAGGASEETTFSASHMTLGVFCAPSILVRSIDVMDARPFLPRHARAVVEARLMPGQDAAVIARGLTEHLLRQLPSAVVEPLLVRHPYSGSWRIAFDDAGSATRYSTAVGDSPAGLLATHGIQSMGFATVARGPVASAEQARISAIAEAAGFVLSLARGAGATTGASR
ncbi:MAG TPA: hypothetical protein VMM78_10905 [Thermomicrobiales bacterium]|nr:hypothetical protein [Thermomicrobiales bacterium]